MSSVLDRKYALALTADNLFFSPLLALCLWKRVQELSPEELDVMRESMSKRPDIIGDKGETCPSVIGGFDHWWNEVQQQCHPRRTSGKELARIAWNAALEKAARECGAAQATASSVSYSAICRELQVVT